MFDLEESIELINYIMFTIVIVVILTKKLPLERMVRRSRLVIWIILIINIFSAFLQIFGLINPDSNISYQLVADCLGIIGQSILLIGIIWMKLIVEQSPKPKKILVLGAHPDDIEIACGGTLAKFCDAGHTITGLILSGGERGGNSLSRHREAMKGAKFLGLNEVEIMNFPDTKLDNFVLEISKQIETVVNELKPDIIFTHSIHDIHQDHRAVHYATLRACRNLSTILCYESPSITQFFQPNVFVNIEQYIDIKIKSVQKHEDQNKKSYVQPEQIWGKAIFRGTQAKLAQAEGFEAIRINLEI